MSYATAYQAYCIDYYTQFANMTNTMRELVHEIKLLRLELNAGNIEKARAQERRPSSSDPQQDHRHIGYQPSQRRPHSPPQRREKKNAPTSSYSSSRPRDERRPNHTSSSTGARRNHTRFKPYKSSSSRYVRNEHQPHLCSLHYDEEEDMVWSPTIERSVLIECEKVLPKMFRKLNLGSTSDDNYLEENMDWE